MKHIKLAAALLAASTVAAQAAEGDTSAWSGESELGYVRKAGNTDSETLTARQKLVFDAKPWKNIITLSATNTSSDGIRSGEKYYATEQLDYFFSERNYAFGRATWEKDRFSGYDYQATWVLGLGRALVQMDSLKMNGEIGAGQSQDRIEEYTTEVSPSVTMIVPEHTVKEAMLYLSQDLTWSFSEGAELGQKLSVEHTDVNTISRFEVYVQSALVGNLAMKVGYLMKFSTDVPDGLNRKDEEMAVTLTYRF